MAHSCVYEFPPQPPQVQRWVDMSDATAVAIDHGEGGPYQVTVEPFGSQGTYATLAAAQAAAAVWVARMDDCSG